MNVLLKDFKSNKIRNLALMQLSTYHKQQGDAVYLNNVPEGVKIDKSYLSVVFSKDLKEVPAIQKQYPDIIIGGGAWDIKGKLPEEVQGCKPDFDLYTVDDIYERVKGGVGSRESKIAKATEIVEAGIGYTSRGCVRKCPFCDVPKKEGALHQDREIVDLINPKSKLIFLLDNNFTADPMAIEKLKEIKERDLTIELTQGIDVRLMTDELAAALASVKHRRTLHYAWDLPEFERPVTDGIKLLSKYIKAYRHKCFMLVGYNTTFEQDTYRFHRLREYGVDPYVMIYRGPDRKVDESGSYELADVRLEKFARWVNGYFFKKFQFAEYSPWVSAQAGK